MSDTDKRCTNSAPHEPHWWRPGVHVQRCPGVEQPGSGEAATSTDRITADYIADILVRRGLHINDAYSAAYEMLDDDRIFDPALRERVSPPSVSDEDVYKRAALIYVGEDEALRRAIFREGAVWMRDRLQGEQRPSDAGLRRGDGR